MDKNEQVKILNAASPGDAKRLGAELKKNNKIRVDWTDICINVMYTLVKTKFIIDKELQKKLLDTGDMELIEGNHWNDTFWGVCRGKGENNLGKILMKVRQEIKNGDYSIIKSSEE